MIELQSGSLKVVETQFWQDKIASIPWPEDQNGRTVFSPHDQYLLTAKNKGEANIWDLSSGKKVSSLKPSVKLLNRKFLNAKFSQDGSKIMTVEESYQNGQKKEEIILWDTHTGHPLIDINDENDILFSANLSSDGRRMMTRTKDNGFTLWDMDKGSKIFRFEEIPNSLKEIHFLPAGKFILACSGQTCDFWDGQTGEYITQFSLRLNTKNNIYITQFKISTDEKQLFVSYSDEVAILIDLQNHTPLGEISQIKEFKERLYFTPQTSSLLKISEARPKVKLLTLKKN